MLQENYFETVKEVRQSYQLTATNMSYFCLHKQKKGRIKFSCLMQIICVIVKITINFSYCKEKAYETVLSMKIISIMYEQQ